VVYAGNEVAGYGELLLIKHDDGWVTAYAHNRRLLVADEARVAAGQTIAEVGQTGSVSSPQLHFEVRNGVQPVNPMQHLPPA
jgi:murein DD-endopeptidase MepM/ murein hydrolase activator NlpD